MGIALDGDTIWPIDGAVVGFLLDGETVEHADSVEVGIGLDGFGLLVGLKAGEYNTTIPAVPASRPALFMIAKDRKWSLSTP